MNADPPQSTIPKLPRFQRPAMTRLTLLSIPLLLSALSADSMPQRPTSPRLRLP